MIDKFTPKTRMLNAYRGVFSDRYPVAPEFWTYIPAKVMGVDIIQFEREVPLWQALQATFKKYDTDGWGIAHGGIEYSRLEKVCDRYDPQDDGRAILSVKQKLAGKEFTFRQQYDPQEASSTLEYIVKDPCDIELFINECIVPESEIDFTGAIEAYENVGQDYLLELMLGNPFFDYIAGLIGFENATYYFIEEDTCKLEDFQAAYIDYLVRYAKKACEQTDFESFFIGCSYSCNSLIGPDMWRKWDKPVIKAVADELHKHGRLLHAHFHGRSMETVEDFAEIGIDCVCPFERSPAGDIDGFAGLKEVRKKLGGKVTMNGNVNTIETLIRGTPQQVRDEVIEIKSAFAGEARLIIGTGDQVGRETPEDNIFAMIEEAKNDNW